jgi:glutaredoxin 3
MHAVIYTKDNCPFCTRAKALFDKKGITYDEKIIALPKPDARSLKENQTWTTREALLEIAPAAKTVPQIWLDGQHIGGHDDLVKYFADRGE